ncbi:MAG: phosphoenolpyruvate--protein phosphotransferase [Acidobacteria bacterium]|nr:phosphoenolpyruvate--protein phosphotransferase [Acidobacteriota bacterium]MBK8811780.1 phosphoenolpyruvate--protein phosphotransferase [Acidobacteriota bacterium]
MKKGSNNPPASTIKARAVSRGIAVGNAVCLFGRKRQFYRIAIEEQMVAKEIRRFRAALRLAKRQLRRISQGSENNRSSIFETHLMILDDRSFLDKVDNEISDRRVNAEWAVKTVTDAYVAAQKAIPDEHLREKYIDLEDISDRILTALGGGRESSLVLEENSIVVAKELRPSTLIELTASNPKAIITEHGGWTSHTFILAREFGLPAITGIKGLLRRVRTGDRLIVDGFGGILIINPDPEAVAKCAETNVREAPGSDPAEALSPVVKTLDGREIAIRANVDIPDVYGRAKRLGARGIGLYRSEFLFNQYKGFPTEAEQIKAYRKIAKEADGDLVRIRTFDLGADQVASETGEREKNPALGLRAIRLMLTNRAEYRTQLRALLQASADFPIDIVLPMISEISEIIETKRLLERESASLRRKGVAVGKPRVGAMIEVPASVIIAEEIGREVDFFCLGTNDLVQYLLAVDRDNASVADSFRTLHPAVLRAIKTVLTAAAKCGIPLVVCGEMAGSPAYVALLIGLGATELSMNVNSMTRVRRTIEGIAYEEARSIVNELAAFSTTEEIEGHVRRRFTEKWAHLFTNELLPAKAA